MADEGSQDVFLEILKERLANSSITFPEEAPNGKMAAVLVPLLIKDGEWNLLFTRRADQLVDHKGEVSFPGGAVEQADHDFVETALRETHEEIGVMADKIAILGALHAFHTNSNYFLKPVVGVLSWPLDLNHNPSEVARTFCIPLKWLADQNNWENKPWKRQNGDIVSVIQYNLYDGEMLWGISARITQELLQQIYKMPEK